MQTSRLLGSLCRRRHGCALTSSSSTVKKSMTSSGSFLNYSASCRVVNFGNNNIMNSPFSSTSSENTNNHVSSRIILKNSISPHLTQQQIRQLLEIATSLFQTS
nr:unnamed protein product [Naegleria fowleri]